MAISITTTSGWSPVARSNLLPGTRLADHRDIGLIRQQFTYPFADDVVVVRDDHSNTHGCWSPFLPARAGAMIAQPDDMRRSCRASRCVIVPTLCRSSGG